MILKAVLFDLHETLAYLSNPLNSEEVSEFLLKHGYEVYPQSWDAATHYVGMIDYPKRGYSNRQAFLQRFYIDLTPKSTTKTCKNLPWFTINATLIVCFQTLPPQS